MKFEPNSKNIENFCWNIKMLYSQVKMNSFAISLYRIINLSKLKRKSFTLKHRQNLNNNYNFQQHSILNKLMEVEWNFMQKMEQNNTVLSLIHTVKFHINYFILYETAWTNQPFSHYIYDMLNQNTPYFSFLDDAGVNIPWKIERWENLYWMKSRMISLMYTTRISKS